MSSSLIIIGSGYIGFGLRVFSIFNGFKANFIMVISAIIIWVLFLTLPIDHEIADTLVLSIISFVIGSILSHISAPY